MNNRGELPIDPESLRRSLDLFLANQISAFLTGLMRKEPERFAQAIVGPRERFLRLDSLDDFDLVVTINQSHESDWQEKPVDFYLILEELRRRKDKKIKK